MAGRKQIAVYEVLVYVAYAYFILLGLAWLTASFVWWHAFDYRALIVVAVYGVQLWFNNRLAHLIVGILTIPICIYGTLEFLFLRQKAGGDIFVEIMLWLSILGIIAAGIILFGYTKQSFKNQ